MTAQQVIIGIGLLVLLSSAVLTLIRIARGPSTLDRVVASEVIVAIMIIGLAMEASVNRHTTTLPVMVVLSLLGFAGSLSMARFVAAHDRVARWTPPDEEDATEEVGEGGDLA